MSEEITYDPATNLPTLPPGHFFRVVAGSYNYTNDSVQIRKRGLLKSKRVWSHDIRNTERSSPEEHQIRDAAFYALTNWQKSQISRARYGDYPPHKLDLETK